MNSNYTLTIEKQSSNNAFKTPEGQSPYLITVSNIAMDNHHHTGFLGHSDLLEGLDDFERLSRLQAWLARALLKAEDDEAASLVLDAWVDARGEDDTLGLIVKTPSGEERFYWPETVSLMEHASRADTYQMEQIIRKSLPLALDRENRRPRI